MPQTISLGTPPTGGSTPAKASKRPPLLLRRASPPSPLLGLTSEQLMSERAAAGPLASLSATPRPALRGQPSPDTLMPIPAGSWIPDWVYEYDAPITDLAIYEELLEDGYSRTIAERHAVAWGAHVRRRNGHTMFYMPLTDEGFWLNHGERVSPNWGPDWEVSPAMLQPSELRPPFFVSTRDSPLRVYEQLMDLGYRQNQARDLSLHWHGQVARARHDMAFSLPEVLP